MNTIPMTCDVCGEEFDCSVDPVWCFQNYDQVRFDFRNFPERKTVIVSYKCCPNCMKSISAFVSRSLKKPPEDIPCVVGEKF